MTDEIHNAADRARPDPPEASEHATEVQREPVHPHRSGPRPERRALVPLWAYGLIAAVLALAAIGVGAAFAVNRSVTRPVPDVVGLDSAVARARIRAAGFEFSPGDKRFSVKPLGTVLEQTPPSGTHARKGSPVILVVSAGTEEFALPDLVGNGILLGRGALEDRGLEVKVNIEASDQPRDTILATNPSPGSIVHTGDIVIVSVAASESVSADVVPYRLGGRQFVLDPTKPSTGADVPLDVSRRLRSLLEASGASVIVTRSLAESGTVISRAKQVQESSATALLGIDVAQTGRGGFVISIPSGLRTERAAATEPLSKALISALTLQSRAPGASSITPDAVIRATAAPVVRLSLGALGNRDDAASFRDTAWADHVARALYRAIGETYGTR